MSRTPVAASGWPHAIAPPYGLRRGSSGATPMPSHQRQHLHREWLVQLEEVDVVDRQPGALEHLLGRRHRSEAHEVRLDAGIGEADEAHPRLEAELRGCVPRGDERGGRAVRQARGVARR